ncbi:SDR family oxidoreductase [Prosthecochloris sp. HL-130-GSB]|jgi:uncharacterized protein YbjT (DUF2867 family)|uniref:SDR family oxidoreductase n=1 Tax=Prosthecochloris sp. HL-130-GSB TaxID=1974213 RepID=UPI000A1C1662|nr:SDR family oxidoreductase [Prosthecochloris sp. HL-130-GSB]ARM30904.1 NAD-dependent epimerase [Prosthecochloris sp. HL-130-GSB]MBO8092642.1 SDR family oxidoreductase [Prosthecochloris sp.]
MRYSGTVLVAGATGRTGQWVVKRLQHYGVDHRLFVRSGEKALELFGPEVTDRLTLGSVQSDEEVRQAMKHADAVICAIGGNVMDPEAPPPSAIDRDGVIRLARIARETGVKRFILVSSMAVTRPDHPLNKYGNVLLMKLEGENMVRELFSGESCSHTVLRPGGLVDGEPLKHRMLFDTGDRLETGRICRSDVAEAAVEALWTPEAHNLTFELVQASEDEEEQESFETYYKKVSSS